MKFQNYHHQYNHHFHIIADFECTLEKCKLEKSNTVLYEKHIVNSYGIKYNCENELYSEDIKIFNSDNPENVIDNFILDIEKLTKKSYELIKTKREIIISDEEKINFNNNTKCNLCKCEYTKENNKKIHYNRVNGLYLQPVCCKCYKKLKNITFIPVLMHNLKGYDSHLFIKSLYKYGTKSDITVIPNNEEKYISFSKIVTYDEKTNKQRLKKHKFEIRFLDTYSFMGSSLESLTSDLKKDDNDIQELRNIFKSVSKEFECDEQFKIILKKGIYPYSYLDTYDKFNDNNLPNKKEFYNKLNNSECSDDDYNQAKLVWNKFKCEKFIDYHNIYLKLDVLLLSDIWDNFRKTTFNNYNLDCSYYYTSPGLAWSSKLKITNVELELISDTNIYKFIEKGIRGGISQISYRYAEANNKYLDNYDKNNEDSYLMYYDANALYSSAMCQYLPYKDFKWNNEIWNEIKILELIDNQNTGYLFEVDITLDKNLHNHFNQYPLFPENLCVNKDNLNDFQQTEYKESQTKKLILTFFDKTEYVVNYRYLREAIKLGYKITKFHRVLQYSQSNFMSEYINLNTKLRQESSNEFDKHFSKLMNNSVYGKTMESIRKRIEFKLISDEKKIDKLKNIKRFTIFDNHLVGVYLNKSKIKLNKPIYLGQNILDDSKVTMFNFHYNFMLKKIEENNLNLMMTDTDSLLYHIKNDDIYEMMNENRELFDLSNYPKNNKLYDNTNNKVYGKFKDESSGVPIKSVICLRPKLYNINYENKKSKNTCKGVKQYISKYLNKEDYNNCLIKHENKNINKSSSSLQNKIALSYNDDKIYISNDNIHCYNFGYLPFKEYK